MLQTSAMEQPTKTVKMETTNQPQTMTAGPPLQSRQPPMEMESDESTETAVKQNAKLISPLKPEVAATRSARQPLGGTQAARRDVGR